MRWDADLAEVPRRYQEFMVPGMFSVLAEAVADAVEPAAGDRALDLACGTGALTRILAGRVGPNGSVTGLDLSDGMLAVARSQDGSDGAAPVEYVQGSAEELPFDDAWFDEITCQQGLQFFPDRPGALREARRVLAPGGQAAFACWTEMPDHAGFWALAESAAAHGGPELRQVQRQPYSLSDPGEMRRLLEEAGFSDVVVEIERVAARFDAAPERFAERVIASTPAAGPFSGLGDAQRAAIAAATAAALEEHRDGDGVAFEMPSLIAVARV
jgi:ubiquinone/menaquinone biosynthesis C-methylase UbiE